MQLVLVAGFNTSRSSNGPVTVLYEGKYKIIMENYIDADIVLHDGHTEHKLTPDCELVLDKLSICQLRIVKPGKETSLTVFAQYDSKSTKPA